MTFAGKRRSPDLRRLALRGAATALFLALVLAWVFFVSSCGRQEAALSTGQVVAADTLPGAKGDKAYAVVQSSALPFLYENFRHVLSDQGLVKWDGRFDCNHLADLYIAVAQARYAVAAWQSNTPAQALALAVIWYQRDAGGAHAIVELRTELGPRYVDPTAGPAPLKLSATEERSIYFRKW